MGGVNHSPPASGTRPKQKQDPKRKELSSLPLTSYQSKKKQTKSSQRGGIPDMECDPPVTPATDTSSFDIGVISSTESETESISELQPKEGNAKN